MSRPIDRIAPEGFVDAIDEQAPSRELDTVDEALRYAHRWLRSSTDPAERRRCPECESRRVILRVDRHRTDDGSKYVCDGCAARFDRAKPPESRGRTDPTTPDRGGGGEPEPEPTAMPHELKTTVATYRFPTGDELRELREALGLSRRAVPVAHYGTIRRWEQGETAPKINRLEELLRYYQLVDAGCRAESLATIVPEPEPLEPEEPEADPFEWVDEPEVRAATDGGR